MNSEDLEYRATLATFMICLLPKSITKHNENMWEATVVLLSFCQYNNSLYKVE